MKSVSARLLAHQPNYPFVLNTADTSTSSRTHCPATCPISSPPAQRITLTLKSNVQTSSAEGKTAPAALPPAFARLRRATQVPGALQGLEPPIYGGGGTTRGHLAARQGADPRRVGVHCCTLSPKYISKYMANLWYIIRNRNQEIRETISVKVTTTGTMATISNHAYRERANPGRCPKSAAMRTPTSQRWWPHTTTTTTRKAH
ncbi:hypothetical protein DENSPDRAFT_58438 [Dentipellis sp. KUC8613]|nr:hypothetical protein DENSPDRAFT_58438 [Dentipellis sp. KUC8613]